MEKETYTRYGIIFESCQNERPDFREGLAVYKARFAYQKGVKHNAYGRAHLNNKKKGFFFKSPDKNFDKKRKNWNGDVGL